MTNDPVRHFRVVDLAKRQHYKHRSPPWIKSHAERLEDIAFASLPDNTKYHLMAIELLAARTENCVPFDERFVRGRINARSRVNLPLLLAQGFIEIIASTAQADRKQSATTEESRVETDSRRSAAGAKEEPRPRQRPQDGTATTNRTATASWSKEAADVWIAAYKGKPPAAYFRHLKAIVATYGWPRVRPVLCFHLAETAVEYLNLPKVLGGSFELLEARMRRSSPQAPRDESENARRIRAALEEQKRKRQLNDTAAAADAVKGAGLSLALPAMDGSGR